MVNTRGNKLHQNITAINSLENNIENTINNATTTINKQTKQSSFPKRPEDNHDSYEPAHRMANVRNQYFNSSDSREEESNKTSRFATNDTSQTTRSSFPPFRLNFEDEKTPSELSIIKDINKHCQISLSYGRFASTGLKKSFLLFANSCEQFDRLMNKNIWPIQICSQEYTIVFPSKVPTSYSIVVLGIPTQWNLMEFETDIKKQYDKIVKVERLYIKGGTPISKVRIDFSSNNDVARILKNKRLLLDDNNTSFAIQPYSPPPRILRCYNCQKYNDHTAAQCPSKDRPICFRCGQNHPYNPSCKDKVCCANCYQDHMAGNPNCPIKIQERKKYLNSFIVPINTGESKQATPPISVWTTNDSNRTTSVDATAMANNLEPNIGHSTNTVIFKKLDAIMNKIEQLSAEQRNINTNIEAAHKVLDHYHKELKMVKEFLGDKLCPFISVLSESLIGKNKQDEKNKLRPLIIKFKHDFQEAFKLKSNEYDQDSTTSLSHPSSYESIGNDI